MSLTPASQESAPRPYSPDLGNVNQLRSELHQYEAQDTLVNDRVRVCEARLDTLSYIKDTGASSHTDAELAAEIQRYDIDESRDATPQIFETQEYLDRNMRQQQRIGRKIMTLRHRIARLGDMERQRAHKNRSRPAPRLSMWRRLADRVRGNQVSTVVRDHRVRAAAAAGNNDVTGGWARVKAWFRKAKK